MTIEETADYVWRNAQIISFGAADAWDDDLFTATWSIGKSIKQPWNCGAGWYWFSVNMSYEGLQAVQRPPTLPKSGCDIGLVSRNNMKVFGYALLCTPVEGFAVVYNGHEANVTGRIRAHFALNNPRTGALGLRHFPLHDKPWIVRYFSARCFSDISDEDKSQIELLMNSYSGRCAVESAWRAMHGWPILCKE